MDLTGILCLAEAKGARLFIGGWGARVDKQNWCRGGAGGGCQEGIAKNENPGGENDLLS